MLGRLSERPIVELRLILSDATAMRGQVEDIPEDVQRSVMTKCKALGEGKVASYP
jgi:hypothetical protein